MCSSAKSLRSIMFDWEPFKKRHLEICSDFGSHYLSNHYSDEHHIWHAHREHFCVLCDAAQNSYYEKWPNSAYSKLLHWAMAKNWGGCSEFLKNLVEHVSGCTYHFLTEWDINIFRRLTFKSPKYKIWWTSVKPKSCFTEVHGKIFGALRPIVSEIFDVEVLRAKTLRHYTQNRLCQLKRYLSYSRLWWIITLGDIFQNSRSPPWPLWMHENSCVFTKLLFWGRNINFGWRIVVAKL